MLEREPFLKAIFAAPDDDLPRLVFADFLEETGDPVWAELIRVQCELGRLHGDSTHPEYHRLHARLRNLLGRLPAGFAVPLGRSRPFERGFRTCRQIEVTVEELTFPDRLRRRAVENEPEWYGATRLKVIDGRILSPGPLATIFASPVTEHVTELDLSGREIDLRVQPADGDDAARPVFNIEIRPVIGVAMVKELARTREARRLTELDLTNNSLDNDAAMALVRSPHLFRLQRLYFHMGNHLRSRATQDLIRRFGEYVVQ
jgi:uncharacterized protein (TIGR02996 family)